MDKYERIPADWAKVGVDLACMIISGIMMICKIDLDYPNVDPWFLFSLTVLAMPFASKNYLINSTELIERIFIIPVRRVQWKNVGSIILCNNNSHKSISYKDPVFLILARECEKHDSKKKNILMKVTVPGSKLYTYKCLFSNMFGTVVEQD